MADQSATAEPDVPEGTSVYDDGKDAPEPEDPLKQKNKDIEQHFRGQIDQAESAIKSRKFAWKRNVELRQGNPLGAYGSTVSGLDDDYQSEINPDWYLTKTKIAALFSQVPRVQLKHQGEPFIPAIGPFAKAINYELDDRRCAMGPCMAEAMADLVNAAGFCAAEVGYAARTAIKQVPVMDPSTMDPAAYQQLIATKQMPMKDVTIVTDYRFFTNRISPVEVLLPASFNQSDFDQAPWVGKKFRTSKIEAKDEWKLSEDQLSQLQGDDTARAEDDLKTNREGVVTLDMKSVRGKRIYYRRYRVDAQCPSFTEIWEIVWLDGIAEPVYHERWKGQQEDPKTGKLIGPTRFPIQVCTTVYITDNPIPPSDTQAGRPQVNDMRRSRSQMFQNREFSKPLRWFNTDKTDPMMHDLIMKGQFQGMIPVQGDGTKLIGEVARASYPGEDLSFDTKTEADLGKMWGLGPNQTGQIASHEVTKGEAELAQTGYNTVMGYERTQVTKFFLGMVEVLAGLMALYSDFPNLLPPEKQAIKQVWDTHGIPTDLVFTILPDTQVVVDTAEQINRTTRFMNLTAKSGFVNVKSLVTELAELHGKDPAKYVVDPTQHPPKPATVSFNFKGREDLQNPMVVAILMENGQFPPPEKIEQARQLLEKLGMLEPLVPPQPPPGMPPGPGGPPAPSEPPPGPMIPGSDQMPEWSLSNKIAQRSRDI